MEEKTTVKEMYEAPAIDVVELKLEGVIASSQDTDGNEGSIWGGGY